MNVFDTEALVTLLALIGGVIIVATLLSGVIERSGFPQIAVFLLLGAALGSGGLGLLTISLDSPILHIVATLSLVLVLFTDAISLNLSEIRRAGVLTLLVVGPGTLLSAALIAFAAWKLLGLSPGEATLLGAALASTDPVLLRGVLRNENIPAMARLALRLESGLNDLVLLPIVVVAMAFLAPTGSPGLQDLARLALDLFVLGPAAGALVGVCGVATMDIIRRNIGIRRDYESLFSLGIAFTAYAAAEAVHGSGFLAAFTAGLIISALDVELCDCFLEYGETTAELTLLFTFVLFGTSLIWNGFTILSPLLIVFAVLALLIRPVAFLASLARVRLSKYARIVIAWFGPRGLSSLLLILLPFFAGVTKDARLFNICAFVVLLSIVVHGGSPFILNLRQTRSSRPPAGKGTRRVLPMHEEPPASFVEPGPASNEEIPPVTAEDMPTGETTQTISPADTSHVSDRLRISTDEVRQLFQAHEPVRFLDVRQPRSYEISPLQARGAVRLDPSMAKKQAQQLGLPFDSWLIAYCT